MDNRNIFLTAAWENLIMANYPVDASVLLPYLPAHTQPEAFNGQCYLSLVGFMFNKVRIKGLAIPFHTSFPEVNLRFYVQRTVANGNTERGVVFISELVPKPAIAWVANTIYRENYSVARMQHDYTRGNNSIALRYSWKWKGRQQSISATVQPLLQPMLRESAEAFIFEHYFGYAKVTETVTHQYQVQHPTWQIYPVQSWQIDCDFAKQYGNDFAFLNELSPASVFVAEGSAVSIGHKTVLG